jgi:hypothetical protein
VRYLNRTYRLLPTVCRHFLLLKIGMPTTMRVFLGESKAAGELDRTAMFLRRPRGTEETAPERPEEHGKQFPPLSARNPLKSQDSDQRKHASSHPVRSISDIAARGLRTLKPLMT